ncbi:HNH endonuclease [Lentilactobacillus hilgardii]|uniref:HNH endonuclease n=2 Tax=Lentilactobacillus hilgardii TaxID=1588 RepID=C0XFL9_LENH9|nr:hypothetical protein [Lentilactobacillus hilgardii]EEI25840.1 hypothetical protein HMPREF0519_0030 [Lentilactobacillus hilgardii DSM 20176 = ATCC 8290]QEU39047.1 HNH endonuclease [Lentilactobacillus hilgardii]TDG82351.1 hypothetical protein C5L34_002446 [Lentilactobacillus hilgardii]
MKLHICHEVGCQALIPMNKRYCDKHSIKHQRPGNLRQRAVSSARNREYNMYHRDPIANGFYHSQEWTKIRNYVAARDYYLDGVTELPVANDRIIVDHIIPRRLLSRDKWLDVDNLWCLSPATHNIKTKLEQSMRDNQLKHCDKRWWIKVLSKRIK